MAKRKKQRERDRRKGELAGHVPVNDWADTGLALPILDDIVKETEGTESGASSDSVFEGSPSMLAAATMGAFGPTAQRRAEDFAMRSKGHGVDIGGVPYSAMTASGHGPSSKERREFMREVMEPAPDKTIANYLTMTEHFRSAAMDDRFVSGGEGGEAPQLVRKVWARLRQARIFDLPPYAYSQAHHLSDRYTTEVLAGCPWHHPLSDSYPTEEEGRRMATMYLGQVGQEFWFDHVPFETTYIGFGKGVPMSPLMCEVRHLTGDFSECFLMGLIIDDADKNIYEMVVGKNRDRGTLATTICRPCVSGKWPSPMDMMRWITPLLLDLINEYRTVVLEQKPGLGMRRDWKKSGKRQGKAMPIPRPYYIVNLKQQVIDERMRKSVRGMSQTPKIYGHRWDVRGHECVKIQRGTLPIDPKLETKLLKAGYRIHTMPGSIPPDDYHRMLERRHATLKQGEWIAILSWWREAFVKGPPDAPYIPAIRKPSRVKRPTIH